MRRNISWMASIAALAIAGSGAHARAQATPADSVTATLRSLFDAMRDADTARTRAAFLNGARVIPVPPQSADTTVGGLTVDAFVAFVGKTGGNPWIETMKNVDVRVSGGVAHAWFAYEVHRGATLSHCGVNAVTLRRAGAGWRIITMAFTNTGASCSSS